MNHQTYKTRWITLSQRWILLAGLVATAPAAEQKNVLLIFSDDLNNYAGTYGHPLAKTPNLDSLAAEGLNFTRAYNQLPVCGPSRACFMTGLYPVQNGTLANNQDFRDTVPNAVTMSQFFMNRGYNSARIGKIYHYGNPSEIGTNGDDDAASWDVRFNPRGIEKDFTDIRVLRGTGANRSWNLEDDGGTGARLSWLSSDGLTNGGQDRNDPLLHTDGLVATKATELIGQYTESGKPPFFLAVGFFKPHTPYIAPKRFFDLYDPADIVIPTVPPDYFNTLPSGAVDLLTVRDYETDLPENLARDATHAYLATISYMDSQLGRVLAAVDDPNGDGDTSDSIRENTIVVFVSDHGYHMGEHNHYQKLALFENSARNPMVIRAPGMATSGQSVGAVVEMIDIYRTLADLAGFGSPADVAGVSLAELFQDATAVPRRAAITQVADDYSIRTATHRYTRYDGDPNKIELYDVLADPEELDNLAFSAPAANVAKIAEMDALLNARFAEAQISPSGDPFAGAAVSSSTPYGGTPLALPGRIEVENYDSGGQGVAFRDTTPGNAGSVHRTDDTDLEATTDAGGGFHLSRMEPNEWTTYTVSLPPGQYRLLARVATPRGNPAGIECFLGGISISTVAATPTGGWQNWQTVRSEPFTLGTAVNGGKLVLRRTASGERFNLNWLEITAISDEDGDGVFNDVELGLGRDPTSIDMTPLPYSEDFESQATGILANSPGLLSLTGPAIPRISATGGNGTTQGLELPGQSTVTQFIEQRYRRNVWVEFEARLQTYGESVAPPAIDAETAACFYLAEGGAVVVRNGAAWQTLTATVDPLQFHRYTIKSDTEAKTWALWIDGVQPAGGSDIAFANPVPNLGRLVVQENQSGGTSAIDNVLIQEGSPGGLDANAGSYASWSAAVSWDGADTSPAGDANGDGAENLLHYFGNSDPVGPGGPALFQQASYDTTGGKLVFRFRRNLSADDISFKILYSTTLGNWQELVLTPDAVATTPIDASTEEITVSISPTPGASRGFVRIEVRQASQKSQ